MAGAKLVSQNKSRNGTNKIHVTLSISESLRTYAKESGINMSSVLESALKSGDFLIKKHAFRWDARKSGLFFENDANLSEFTSNAVTLDYPQFVRACDSCVSQDIEELNAISQERVLVNGNPVYTNSTRVFSNYENNTQNFALHDSFINYANILVNTIMTKAQNFNPSPEFIAQIITAVNLVNSQMNIPQMLQAPAPQFQSIAEYFSNHSHEFQLYAVNDGIKTPKTLTTYINNLNKMHGITKPSDLTSYSMISGKQFTNSQKLALAKLIKYMRFVDGLESFNGYSLEKWSLYLRETKVTVGKCQSRARNISTDGLREAVSLMHHKHHDDFIKKMAKLLYYSGARAEQLLRLLAEKEKEIIIDGDICIVNAHKIQIGDKKRAFKFYFPAECADFIRKCKIPSLSCRTSKPKYENQWIVEAMRATLSTGERVTAAIFRKFNYNVYRVDCKIEKSTADMLQSRVSGMEIGDKHYLSQDEICRDAYKQAVKVLRERLPWE